MCAIFIKYGQYVLMPCWCGYCLHFYNCHQHLLFVHRLMSAKLISKVPQLSASLVFDFCSFFFHFQILITYWLYFRIHSKDVTSVAFHRKYPLFASSSEDCTAYVCHGMVYSDLNQNPLIVPLGILRGHSSSDGRGMHVTASMIFAVALNPTMRIHHYLQLCFGGKLVHS
jgi:hypothetical protein